MGQVMAYPSGPLATPPEFPTWAKVFAAAWLTFLLVLFLVR